MALDLEEYRKGLERMDLEEYRKRASSDYHKAADATADVVVEALCVTYKSITGKKASDRMRDAFYYTVRYDQC